MENHKSLKFIIVLLLAFFGLKSEVLAYSIETHAYLTDQIFNFYNKHFPQNKIPEELRVYLIDGARREDDIPRWMNHFYDPVYDRGLVDSILGKWQKSKNWAKDSANQNSLTYRVPATIASILTAIQQRKLSLSSNETDFTWQRAIKLYLQGNKEKAMFALGHILHLIEDASVPDHTRNDPHPGDSPYEDWTKKFTLSSPDRNLAKNLEGKKPIELHDLDSYFDELAKYSNNNFYSKDTIGIQSGYKLPEPETSEFLKKDGDYYYIGKYDENKNFYYLAVYKNYRKNLLIETKLNLVLKIEDEDKVVSDYWSRLSPKAVQYGAGVINLFFEEVERAKNDLNFAEEKNKSFLAEVIDSFKNIINQAANFFFGSDEFNQLPDTALNNNDFQPIENNDLIESVEPNLKKTKVANTDNNSSTSIFSESLLELAPFPQDKRLFLEKNLTAQNLTSSSSAPETSVPETSSWIKCNFSGSNKRSDFYNKIIINEIAWIKLTTDDQWIELKNTSDVEIDLTGWQLINQNEEIKVIFPEEKKILPKGFILLESSSDDSAPGVAADLIYAGLLSESSDGLRLFDNQCNLVDEVLAQPNWPAGEKEGREKKTMERSISGSWYTSRVLGGTPKEENSPPTTYGSYSQLSLPENQSSNFQNQLSDFPSPEPAKILITEIQITGGYGFAENDFVELYNPNDRAVNLKGYRLVKRTKTGSSDILIKSWENDVFIPPKGFYLWANSGYNSISFLPQATTTQTLSEDNGIALRFGSNDSGIIVDRVGWGEVQNDFIETQAFSTNPGAEQSIARKLIGEAFIDTENNADDFEIKNCPSPGLMFKTCSLSETTSLGEVNHLLISEVYPDKTGNNFDFVELYNPSDVPVSLANYSLKILKESATTSESLASFSSNHSIAPKGFFLVGFDDYNQNSSTSADVFRSSSFLPTTQTAQIILVEKENIIDTFQYDPASLLPGHSFERKALDGGICLSAAGEGEFLGNGCDTDSFSDWETREKPKPQNSQNLPEPRVKPTTPEDFTIYYASSSLELTLSWKNAQDFNNSTSAIIYKLTDISGESSTLNFGEISSTSTTVAIKEVGRNYAFALQAFDRDGLSSDVASSTIFVPSFIKELYFYKDPRSTESSKYLVEFTFDTYPFLPDIRLLSGMPTNNWKALVFYFDQDAPQDEYIQGTSPPTSQALSLTYRQCNGYYSPKKVLILADSSEGCQSFGEIRNEALQLEYLEDNRFLGEITLPSQAISPDNFITVAYYGFTRFYPQGSENQNNFRLIAVDKLRYHFQDKPPFHEPPTLPSYELSFDRNNSSLIILSSLSKDNDSVDKLISYQFNFTTSTEQNFGENNWRPMEANGNNFRASFEVVYKNSYFIGVKAIDEFGNYSFATTSWNFPDDFLIIAAQKERNGFFNPNPTAVAQAFSARYSGYARSLEVISQGFYNGLRGSMQAFLYNITDPSKVSPENLLAVSSQEIVEPSKQKYVFAFPLPPFLEAGQNYLWLIKIEGGTSNFEGVGEEAGAFGDGWTQFGGGGNWYRCGNVSDSCYGARNYYFVLFGSNSAE